MQWQGQATRRAITHQSALSGGFTGFVSMCLPVHCAFWFILSSTRSIWKVGASLFGFVLSTTRSIWKVGASRPSRSQRESTGLECGAWKMQFSGRRKKKCQNLLACVSLIKPTLFLAHNYFLVKTYNYLWSTLTTSLYLWSTLTFCRTLEMHKC